MKGVVRRQIESAGVSNWHTAPIPGEQTIKSMHTDASVCAAGSVQRNDRKSSWYNERATKDSPGCVFCPSLYVYFLPKNSAMERDFNFPRGRSSSGSNDTEKRGHFSAELKYWKSGMGIQCNNYRLQSWLISMLRVLLRKFLTMRQTQSAERWHAHALAFCCKLGLYSNSTGWLEG